MSVKTSSQESHPSIFISWSNITNNKMDDPWSFIKFWIFSHLMIHVCYDLRYCPDVCVCTDESRPDTKTLLALGRSAAYATSAIGTVCSSTSWHSSSHSVMHGVCVCVVTTTKVTADCSPAKCSITVVVLVINHHLKIEKVSNVLKVHIGELFSIRREQLSTKPHE